MESLTTPVKEQEQQALPVPEPNGTDILKLSDGRIVIVRAGTGRDQAEVNRYMDGKAERMQQAMILTFCELCDDKAKLGRRRFYKDEVDELLYGDFIKLFGAVAVKNGLSADNS